MAGGHGRSEYPQGGKGPGPLRPPTKPKVNEIRAPCSLCEVVPRARGRRGTAVQLSVGRTPCHGKMAFCWKCCLQPGGSWGCESQGESQDNCSTVPYVLLSLIPAFWRALWTSRWGGHFPFLCGLLGQTAPQLDREWHLAQASWPLCHGSCTPVRGMIVWSDGIAGGAGHRQL